jgi:hypothetical protein
VVSDSALGSDLARSFRWIQIVLVLILVVCILVFVLILALHFLANHWRLALGEAASDSAWAEVTAIWQVLESHLSLLRIVSAAVAAASHVKC